MIRPFCLSLSTLLALVLIASPLGNSAASKESHPNKKLPNNRHHLYRRHGLRRHWSLRSQELQNAPSRPDGHSVPYEHPTISLELFDLHNDLGETTNVADKHPEIVARLEKFGEQARLALGDRLTKRTGNEVRPHGILP